MPLQQLALQQQHEQQRQEQASKQPDPVPAPSSSSGGRVIVTPLHPEGLKLMEERRRQSVDTPTEVLLRVHSCTAFASSSTHTSVWQDAQRQQHAIEPAFVR